MRLLTLAVVAFLAAGLAAGLGAGSFLASFTGPEGPEGRTRQQMIIT